MKKWGLWREMIAAAVAIALVLPVSAADVGESSPAYTLSQRGSGFPVRVEGTVSELGKDSLTLESRTDDGTRKLVVNVTSDTRILDAGTGEARSFSDMGEGEDLCAWVGPAMTKSLPPVTTAAVLLDGLTEQATTPVYAEVRSVVWTDEGVDLSVTGDVTLHLQTDTPVLTAPGSGEAAALSDIRPGSRLLSWYAAALGKQDEAAPEKILVFPYAYEGYVAVRGLNLALNGTWMTFSDDTAPRVEGDRLMVPVRALSEALGCSVAWEPYTGRVTVSRDGAELYRFTIGGDQAVKGAVTVGLLVKTHAVNGVTLMALDDFMSLQELKLAGG